MTTAENGTQLPHLRRLTTAQVIVGPDTADKVYEQFREYEFYTGHNPETSILQTAGLEPETLDQLAVLLNVPAKSIEDTLVVIDVG